MKEACDDLKKSTFVPLKSVADARLDIFRFPPSADQLSETLRKQFDDHLEAGRCTRLSVSDVDPGVIFEAYFQGQPPFDIQKKKMEFPDAFTHQRLAMWAEENEIEVYVVGPDPDLKRICSKYEHLRHFEKLELVLDYINRGDELVRRLKEKPEDLITDLSRFVTEEFGNLEFTLEYNPHGDIENVSVSDVEIGDIYALDVTADEVVAEAEAKVSFSADFSYEDLDSGFYDKETGRRYMSEYVHGEIEDSETVEVTFTFSISPDNNPIISDPAFTENRIAIEEEDRGDYGAWK
jgi:PIN domain